MQGLYGLGLAGVFSGLVGLQFVFWWGDVSLWGLGFKLHVVEASTAFGT